MDTTEIELIPAPLTFGKEVNEQELVEAEAFPAPEGTIMLIYGRIRNGKSTEAVRRMYDSLSNGRVVYSNIDLNLSGELFDDRLMFAQSFKNLVVGRRRYYRFLTSNFRCFNPTTGICKIDGKEVQVFDPRKPGDEIRWLNSLTDCEIYYDEGQWLLDSYEKTYVSVDKRKLITESGHCNRTIIIIAQRTQSVHVNARGNVNQFFRCQKITRFFFFVVLQVEEFQDMKGQDVDETEPVSVTIHWSSKKYWGLFNTHYLRAGRPKSQFVHYQAFDLNVLERFSVLLINVFSHVGLGRLFTLKREQSSAPEAREIILPVADTSLGVELDSTTLNNGERLNTVPMGGVRSPYERKFKSDRDKKRSEYFANLARERNAKKGAISHPPQDEIPF